MGLTAGASAPEILVEQVSEHLAALGFTNQRDLDLIREDVRFTLPPELTTIAPASKLGLTGFVDQSVLERENEAVCFLPGERLWR